VQITHVFTRILHLTLGQHESAPVAGAVLLGQFEDLAEQSRDTIRMAMEETFREMFGTTVPIVAEAKACRNWGEK
jgi:hypothetical protein